MTFRLPFRRRPEVIEAKPVLRWACLLGAALLTGCWLVWPSNEVYLLTLLDGRPLPGNMETPVDGGHRFGLQVTSSVMTVRPSAGASAGRMSVESRGWLVYDSVRTAPYADTLSGPFERVDSTIVFRYDNPWGFVVHFTIREGGCVIFIRDDFAPGASATKVYERKE